MLLVTITISRNSFGRGVPHGTADLKSTDSHVGKKTWACPKMRYEGYTAYPLKNSNFNETVRINHDILLVPYFGQAQILD